MNIKSENGSITLLVITACLFFLVAVTTVGMHMGAKKAAVDREYKQIKESYEKDVPYINERYNKLKQENELEVSFDNATADENTKKILLNASIDTQNLDIKSLKYGWYFSDEAEDELSSNNITNWTFIENTPGENSIALSKTCTNDEINGYHYLCFVVNNKEYWKKYKTTYLPDEYQRIEYIEGTGTQYIDTNYYASANTHIKLKFSYAQENGDQYANGMIFGSANNNNGRPSYSIGLNLDDTFFYRNDNNANKFSGPVILKNEIYTVDVLKNTIQINDTVYNSSMNLLTATQTYSSYLFARHSPPSSFSDWAYCRFKGKIYYFNIYEENIPKRVYIPCYRIMDNEIGMYDLSEGIFYTNMGTETFLKGEDISNFSIVELE